MLHLKSTADKYLSQLLYKCQRTIVVAAGLDGLEFGAWLGGLQSRHDRLMGAAFGWP